MRIVFCANYNGQTGTTSNVSAIACSLAMQEKMKVYLMQTQFGNRGLDWAFLGQPVQAEEGQENGIDGLIRMIKSEPVTKEMLDSCSIGFLQNRLLMLPGSVEQEACMYEQMVKPMVVYCMNAAYMHYEMVLIDAGCWDLRKRQALFDYADVIVMNLSQNVQVLNDCYAVDDIYRKKMFYLIGLYDAMSKYNVPWIRHRYKIPKERLAVVPYNAMFRDAYSDGQVLKYITQIHLSTREEMNYDFEQQVMNAGKKIIAFGERLKPGITVRKKVSEQR